MESKLVTTDEEKKDEVRAPETAATTLSASTFTDCFICKNNESNDKLFKYYPCGCCALCKKCAMKIATGGKCKICKQLYSSVTSFV